MHYFHLLKHAYNLILLPQHPLFNQSESSTDHLHLHVNLCQTLLTFTCHLPGNT